MEYVIITLVTISSTAFVFYWLANSVFGYTIKLKSLLLCGGCAVLLSLVVPRVIVSYAGFVGTLAILSVIAVMFAYFVAYYDNSTSTPDRQTSHTSQEKSFIDMEIEPGVANQLSITPAGASLPIDFSNSMDKTDLENDSLAVEKPRLNSLFVEVNSQSNNEDDAAQSSDASNSNDRIEELLEHRSIHDIGFEVNDESDVAPSTDVLDEVKLVKSQFSCVDDNDTDNTNSKISLEINALAESNVLTSSLSSVGEITEGFDEGNQVGVTNESITIEEESLPTDILKSMENTDLKNDNPTVEKSLLKSLDSNVNSQSNIEDDIAQCSNVFNSYDRTEGLSAEKSIHNIDFRVNDESDVSLLTDVLNKTELLIKSEFLPVKGDNIGNINKEISPVTDVLAEPNVLPEDSLTIHTVTGDSVEESSILTDDKCSISQTIADISATVESSAMDPVGETMGNYNESKKQNGKLDIAQVSQVEERKELFDHLDMYEIAGTLPVALDELMEVAFRYKESNHLHNALVAFKKALNLYPNCDAAPFLIIEIGTLQKNIGHFDEAINTFSEGRRMAVSLNDCVLEKEFIEAIAYLRIVKNALVKNRMFGTPFKDIPNVILHEIDEEFTEWRSLVNII